MRRLRISPNQRFLQHEDGKPFFYLGDTAWELFHKLDRDDIRHYADKRAQQGFTVVQAVCLAELGGLRVPNREGHLPLHDNDPTRPNEAYFRLVDFAVETLAARGMWTGMLPTWGDKFCKMWGEGPVIFNPENAFVYGKWLSDRYADAPILWILGGDRPATDAFEVETVRAMAKGIRAGKGGHHLMSYHPMGENSTTKYWPDEPWLDFHMLQTGHVGPRRLTEEWIARDYAHKPTKPVMDAEPPYEDHPRMNSDWSSFDGYHDDLVVRQAAYGAVFSGAHGHTYGCHPVWQMHRGGEPVNRARRTWSEALDLPGAWQVGHLRRLMESLPFFTRVPASEIVLDQPSERLERAVATRDAEGSYAMVYTPVARPVSVDLGWAKAPLALSWFDPRSGQHGPSQQLDATSRATLTPPPSGPDWVALLRPKS